MGVEGDTWLPMNQMVGSCSGVQKMCRREHPSHAEKGWWSQENVEGADNGTDNREGFCCKTCEVVKKHMAQLYIQHQQEGHTWGFDVLKEERPSYA